MQGSITTLRCPKCEAPMRVYERSGVTIDQCSECRGVFLDQGELQRLMDAERDHYASGGPGQGGQDGRGGDRSQQPPPRDDRAQYDQRDGRDKHGSGGHGSDHGSSGGYGNQPPKKRRGSFLEELLDFG